MENFKLANEVVRFVLYETVTWRQERRKGPRQMRGEQGITMFPGRRWRASRGGQEDHQQDWEARAARRERGSGGSAGDGRWKVPPGRPASVPGTDPTLNKPSHHRKAFYNFWAAVFLVG